MFIRYLKANRQLLHLSTVPFTISPKPGEADAEVPPVILSGDAPFHKVREDFSGVDRDPSLVHPDPRFNEHEEPSVNNEIAALKERVAALEKRP